MTSLPFPKWTARGQDAAFTAPAKMAQTADRFDRTIRRRNRIEYAAGIFGVIVSLALAALFAAIGEFAQAAPVSVLGAGFLIVMRNLRRRASRLDRFPEEPCIDHLRRQYRQQAHALRSVAGWYVAPLVPGFIAMQAAIVWDTAQVQGWAHALAANGWPFVAIAAFLFGVIALNRWAARGLTRKIDELDALT